MVKQTSIAPLVVFRIAFGFLMLFSITRFIIKGWVESMYITPKVFFPYYGFEWIKPLPEWGMYLVFAILLLSCLGIILGLFYRVSTILFFTLFTYIELIDKTNYLNHYYFISLIAFILIFLPAGKAFSIDNRIKKKTDVSLVSNFYILLPQLQMFTLYFFAGVAKLNYDWLFEAQPLKLWLPAFVHYPIIGAYMEQDWVAYLFSWFGCIYDLTIGFLLFNRRTARVAYLLVIIFHMATAMFFNIGMFPYIMMTITIIFFSPEYHEKLLSSIKTLF
ncbi:MAG: HTTM domain-containing protein, partial [Bacteroidia bacterium]